MKALIDMITARVANNKSHGVAAVMLLVGALGVGWHVAHAEGWMKTAAPTFALEGGMMLLLQGAANLAQAADGSRRERKLDVNTAITAEASPEAAARIMTPPAGPATVASTTQQVAALPVSILVEPAKPDDNIDAQVRAMVLLAKSKMPVETIESIIRAQRNK